MFHRTKTAGRWRAEGPDFVLKSGDLVLQVKVKHLCNHLAHNLVVYHLGRRRIISDPVFEGTRIPLAHVSAVVRRRIDNDVPDSALSYLDTSPKKQRYLEHRVIRALAGTVAQDLKFPSRHHDPGDRQDYEKALELIKCFATSEEHHTAYVKMLRINARDRLRKYWPWVEAVATALLKHDQLSGESLLQIVRSSAEAM